MATEEKRLAKIKNVRFGHGGYQGMQFGLYLGFGGEGWGVSTFEGAWDPTLMERSEHAAWTEVDRSKELDNLCRNVSKYLSQAKVDDVAELKDKPVEITFEGQIMKSWRLLTEVI